MKASKIINLIEQAIERHKSFYMEMTHEEKERAPLEAMLNLEMVMNLQDFYIEILKLKGYEDESK